MIYVGVFIKIFTNKKGLIMAISRYRYFPKTLDANAQEFINVVGNYVYLISNTGASATIKVSFDDGEFQILPVGIILKTSDFQKVTILNSDSGSASFVLAVGYGDIDNKAFTIASTVVTNPSSTGMNTPASVTVTTTAAALVAANANRREVVISNNGTAGEIVWLGDTNVNAASGRGIPLRNGEKIVLSTQAVIWADADTGTPAVSYMEMTGS